MGLQEADFDGDSGSSRTPTPRRPVRSTCTAGERLVRQQKANSWASIAGTATEAYDRAKAEELWNPFVKVWFPDGLDTPGLTLTGCAPSRGRVLGRAQQQVLHLIGYAKAAVTGKPPEAGENREVSYPG